jgi:hypothetical protein
VRPAEECRVFLRDHHEGYIDWETFEENLQMIRSNSLKRGGDEAVAAVRAGQGLLVGLLRCGRCGHKLHVRYWGKSGTAARYLCKGDFETGGQYCLGFGGATVDRRFSQELLAVISPLGMQASLEAIERLSVRDQEQRHALARQLQQCEYEAQRAFEQYNEVDPRHRLVAAELERRWNAKLEEVAQLRSALGEMERAVRVLGQKEKEQILGLGRRFSAVWDSADCPVELKKRIIGTVVEEVIVNEDEAGQTLEFLIHWNGGTHTRFQMPKPPSGVGQKTALEDLEVIRRMAIRYGDDEIARVLNKLGRRTARGKRWNEHRVAAARRRYAIAGQKRSTPEPEILTLGRAAKYCGVSNATIKRLVAGGLVEREQVAPWAPWEIRRSDLDSPQIQTILTGLRETGKLVLGGDDSKTQPSLF